MARPAEGDRRDLRIITLSGRSSRQPAGAVYLIQPSGVPCSEITSPSGPIASRLRSTTFAIAGRLDQVRNATGAIASAPSFASTRTSHAVSSPRSNRLPFQTPGGWSLTG